MSKAKNRSPFDLSDQTALITGGGSGLGLAMARCFVAAGAQVVLVGRRESELKKACEEIGSGASMLVGDITQLKSAPILAEEAEHIGGPISILVNNAGVHLKKDAIETSDADFASVMNTHVFGAFALTREIGKRMLKRRSGCVLFTASMSSFMGVPKAVAYSAAKSAYLGMVRTLATEWGPHEVRVNGIAPGWISSDMLDASLSNDSCRRSKILSRTPMGRFGDADDIGWAAVYLASPAAKFVNGVVLPVDGGAAHSF